VVDDVRSEDFKTGSQAKRPYFRAAKHCAHESWKLRRIEWRDSFGRAVKLQACGARRNIPCEIRNGPLAAKTAGK
jgi:hypothetical protein